MRIFLSILSFILVIGFALLATWYGSQEKWLFMVMYIISSVCWVFVGMVNAYLAGAES